MRGRLGNTKIDDFGSRTAVLDRNQDIRRFDVAMDDTLLMGVLYAIANRCEEGQALLCAQPLGVAILRQRNSADVFHGEKRSALVGRARLEGLGDVGVVHERQGLPLGFESSQYLLGVHPPLDQFERHPAPNRGLLLGLPHLAHSPLANFLKKVEVADPFGRTSVVRRVRCRAVDLQQGVYLATKVVVPSAFLVEIRCAFVARQLAGCQKDLLGPTVTVDAHDDSVSDSLRRSHAWACRQSFSTVRFDTPITSATCSTVNPPKKRRVTTFASRSSISAS